MDNVDIIRELSETKSRSLHNESEIRELKEDVMEIKKENQAIHDIATSVKLIAQDMGYVKNDIAEVKDSQSQMKIELSEVKNAPDKSKAALFDSAWKGVLAIVGTAVLAFVLGQIAPTIFLP